MSDEKLKLFGVGIDDCSKLLAGGLIAVYLLGYLILTLHFSKYGFSQIGLLRPRVLEVGAACFILTAIPITLGLALNSIPAAGLSGMKISTLRLAVLCVEVQLLLGSLTAIGKHPGIDFSPIEPSWGTTINALVMAILIMTVTVAAIVAIYLVAHYDRFYRSVSILAWFVSLLVFFSHMRHSSDASSHIFFYWAACAAIIVLLGSSANAAKPNDGDNVNASSKAIVIAEGAGRTESIWTYAALTAPKNALVFIVFFVAIYTNLVFGSIPYDAGGGQPLQIDLYTKTSTLPQKTSGELLDESEHGFFLVPHGKQHALFIPRDMVERAEFGVEF